MSIIGSHKKFIVDTTAERDSLLDNDPDGNPIYVAPVSEQEGIEVYVKADKLFYKWIDGAYELIGGLCAPIPDITGEANKVLRVKSDESGFEYVAATGTGDMLGTNNLSDVSSIIESKNNLDINA